jgi:hypothetical protein
VGPFYSTKTLSQVTGILQGTVLLLDMVFIQEPYVPALLARKAAQLYILTSNWTLHAEWEDNPIHLKDHAVKFNPRPLQMLATPICLSITIYVSFMYATVHASLASFLTVFQETRGWNEFTGSLLFLAVLRGIAVGAGVNVANQKISKRHVHRKQFIPCLRGKTFNIGAGRVAYIGE